MASTHCLSRNQTARGFSSLIPPALEIDPGDTVVFETDDSAYERLYRGEAPDAIDPEAYNPVTGPVRVRGSEPGDALRIEVLAVEPERVWAVV